MAASHEDDPDSLQIRCPSCSQKFKVGHELRGRMVECGECDTQFRVNDETIVRSKKFYPGERRDVGLQTFARRPLDPTAAGVTQKVYYRDDPSPVSFEPGPQRMIAGLFAGVIILLTALLLGFGAHQGRMLDGVSQMNRLFLALFVGIVGSILVIYANPRARKKATVGALLIFAGLVAMPFIFTDASEPLAATGGAGQREEGKEPEAQDSAELVKTLGLDPLIAENQRLARGDKAAGKAIGIWLRDLKESNKLMMRDHLTRESGADPDANMFVRDRGDWLMVMTGVKRPIEEIAVIAAKVGQRGRVEHVYPELNLIEVIVDNSSFVEGPVERLNDKSHPAFYELNKRELDSVDLERARRAVKRLADAEPKIFRDDIVRRLSQMLAITDNGSDAGDICRALLVWSTPEQGFATKAATDALRRLRAAGTTPPREMVAFLVARKETSVAADIDQLWTKDHTAWEQLYGELGPVIEPLVLGHLDDSSIVLRHSAMRLIARVGTAKSLPKIQALRAGADTEMRVLLDRAEASINQRSSNR